MRYEVHRLRPDGTIADIEAVESPDDLTAELLAWRLMDGEPLEIRRNGKLVKRLDLSLS